MVVKVKIQHRPSFSDSIDQKARFIMEQLRLVDALWEGAESRRDGEFRLQELGATLYLDDALGKGFSNVRIHFSIRDQGHLEVDKASRDDTLVMDIDTNIVDYRGFVSNVFPRLIEILDAYRATVFLDEDLDLDDYENIIDLSEATEKDIDGRDTVYRINSVNYFDRELCLRAFSASPEEIVNKLEGKVESVSLLGDGVLLIYSSEILPRDDLERVDSIMRPLIQHQ